MTQLSHQKYKYNNNYCEIFKITYVKIYEAAIIDRNIKKKKVPRPLGIELGSLGSYSNT